MIVLRPFRGLLHPAIALFFVSLILFACKGATAFNDVQLEDAAQHLRDRQYQEALQSCLKAPDSGRRSFMLGLSLLRLGRPQEALPYLQNARKEYPLLADQAAALQATALFQLKQYREAAEAASKAAKASPVAALRQRMAKLVADALFEAGELKQALSVYQQFSARYNLGLDSVDARYQTAVCHERLGDLATAINEYRALWLRYPAAAQAGKALEAIKRLDPANGLSFTADELYRRATLLLAAGRANDAATALAAIPRTNLSDDQLTRIYLKSGVAAIKQRQFTLAETVLTKAAAGHNQALRDEARLKLARVEERNGESERSLARLLSLSSERGPLADDALLEAGFTHKHAGRFGEAIILFERLSHDFPKSDLAARATWEAGWCRYLTGDWAAAAAAFQHLQQNPVYRERALYWYARTLARQKKSQESGTAYTTLLKEYPFGFYAAWYRSQQQLAPGWEPLPQDSPPPPLPPGSERILALIASGLTQEARAELAALQGAAGSNAQAPGIARLYQLAGDPHGAIITFHQNRPTRWDQQTLPFWALGYPRPYAELFAKYTAADHLSEGVVLALTKAESSFRATVRSPVGAIGLMQLMPNTARLTARAPNRKNFTPLRLIDPDYNIRLGTRHLRVLFDRYNQDTAYTLAAYNAGSAAVNRWRKAFGSLDRDEFIENIPYYETRDYVKKIIAEAAIYKALYHIP